MADRRPPRPGGGGPGPRPGGGRGPGPSRRPGGSGGGPHRARRPAGGGTRRPAGPAPGGPRGKSSDRGPRAEAARPGEERLNKLLAHAGVGSRRACEELILQGRITVDGKVVRELGTKVDPSKQAVAVDGQRIREERHVYIALFKPKGYVSTNNDPAGRPRVLDLLPEIPQRVYTIGRLDEASTGLMLLTNDGELANRLAHPKFGVEKVYRVVVAGSPGPEVLTQLTDGIWLAEGKVKAKRVRAVGKRGESTILEMVLAEGKNREVRRMLAKLGHKVMSLTRVSVGPISIKGLKVGESRPLSGREVDLLRRAAEGEFTRPTSGTKLRDDRPRASGPGASTDRRESPAGRGPRPRVDGPPPRSYRRTEDGPPQRRPQGQAGGPPPRPSRPLGDGPPPQRRPQGQAGGPPPRPARAGGDGPPRRRPEGQGGPPRPSRPLGDGPPPQRRPQAQGGPSPRPSRPTGDGGPPPRRPGPQVGPARRSGPPPRPTAPSPDVEIEVSPIGEGPGLGGRPRRVIGLDLPKPAGAGPRPKGPRIVKLKPPRRGLGGPKGPRVRKPPKSADE